MILAYSRQSCWEQKYGLLGGRRLNMFVWTHSSGRAPSPSAVHVQNFTSISQRSCRGPTLSCSSAPPLWTRNFTSAVHWSTYFRQSPSDNSRSQTIPVFPLAAERTLSSLARLCHPSQALPTLSGLGSQISTFLQSLRHQNFTPQSTTLALLRGSVLFDSALSSPIHGQPFQLTKCVLSSALRTAAVTSMIMFKCCAQPESQSHHVSMAHPSKTEQTGSERALQVPASTSMQAKSYIPTTQKIRLPGKRPDHDSLEAASPAKVPCPC
jgi:hypothetical protein